MRSTRVRNKRVRSRKARSWKTKRLSKKTVWREKDQNKKRTCLTV